MSTITLWPRDIAKIAKIIEENNVIRQITLIQSENHNGIGDTLDIEIYHKLNGRDVIVRAPIVDESDW